MPPSYWGGFGESDGSEYNEVPSVAYRIWHDTTEESSVWDGLPNSEQTELESRFADDLYTGDVEDLMDLLDYLDVYWDNQDWDDWREAYDATH